MNREWTEFSDLWPWASFVGRRRFFESGGVRLALLSLLNEGPKHGYQLMKEMEERSGGLYRASAAGLKPVHDWVRTFEHFWQSQLDRIKARAEEKARQATGSTPNHGKGTQ